MYLPFLFVFNYKLRSHLLYTYGLARFYVTSNDSLLWIYSMLVRFFPIEENIKKYLIIFQKFIEIWNVSKKFSHFQEFEIGVEIFI